MIVLVGEQWRGSALPAHLNNKWAADDWTPAEALSHGAYNGGGGRAKLEEVGLVWDASCNLLPPGLDWNDETAGVLAGGVLKHMRTAWIVMCGHRAARAFNALDLVLFDICATRKLVAFPHPSGRSRVWHDPANWGQARACVRQLLMLNKEVQHDRTLDA